MRAFVAMLRFGFLVLVSLIILLPGVAQQPPKPYKVKIVGEKDNVMAVSCRWTRRFVSPTNIKVVSGFAPPSTVKRFPTTRGPYSRLMEGLSDPAVGQKQQKLQDLPEGPGGKKRYGGRATWELDGVRVTMSLEAVPGKQYQPQAIGTTRSHGHIVGQIQH